MACHNHKSKLKRRYVLHKCIQTWRAPAVEFWTLEIAPSSSDDIRIIRPDKINTLAHGCRTGWHGKPTRKPTGRQADIGRQQGDMGGDRATGEVTGRQGRWQGDMRGDRPTGDVTGRQGRWQGDRGGLAKWGKINKSPLLQGLWSSFRLSWSVFRVRLGFTLNANKKLLTDCQPWTIATIIHAWDWAVTDVMANQVGHATK